MNRNKNCNICHKKFDVSLLLQSSRDEYFCKECFKSEYCMLGRPKSEQNPKIKDPPTLIKRCEGDTVDVSNCMFNIEDIAAFKRQKHSNFETRKNSKKPIQCPHADCNRYVSIFDLCMHFKSEHPNIPVSVIQMDKRISASFNPKDIRYGIKQCLLLFNVMLPETANNTGGVTFMVDKIQVPLTVAALASRISPVDMEDEEVAITDEEHARNSLVFSDKIAVWVASNIATNLTYTVAVSSNGEEVRVKYFGAIRQLGHDPKTMCRMGQCLILNNFHAVGMSENGLQPLKLDVIVHADD